MDEQSEILKISILAGIHPQLHKRWLREIVMPVLIIYMIYLISICEILTVSDIIICDIIIFEFDNKQMDYLYLRYGM